MADLEELKKIAEAGNKTLHDLRETVEAKANSADVVDKETLAKAKAEFAEQLTKEQNANAELKARVEAIETKSNRPGAPDAEQELEAKNFDGYLRGQIGETEYKAMATNSQVDGGFMVVPTMLSGIQERMRRTSPIRAIASVYTASTLELLVERGDAGFEWAGETQSRSDTSTPTVHKISIPTHELSALPKVSQRMLDTANFDAGAWLESQISDRFSRAEATAFVSGSGVNQPKGFLSYGTATGADDSRAIETLQYRASGASGDFASSGPADVFVETFYDLQGVYQDNATWVMKNTTAAAVSVLKDGDGRYLVREILNGSGAMTRTIQGRPLLIADDMPAIGANSLSIAVGDFSKYGVVDNGSVTVLRDPYSAKPHVLFYATKRVGGGVTDFDAIKLIKFATS
jgi:HK97 family phage major capsid protein